jgi:hypothetical protein
LDCHTLAWILSAYCSFSLQPLVLIEMHLRVLVMSCNLAPSILCLSLTMHLFLPLPAQPWSRAKVMVMQVQTLLAPSAFNPPAPSPCRTHTGFLNLYNNQHGTTDSCQRKSGRSFEPHRAERQSSGEASSSWKAERGASGKTTGSRILYLQEWHAQHHAERR